MKQKATYAILAVLMIAGYLTGYVSVFLLDSKINMVAKVTLPFITYILMLLVIWLNKDKLVEFNIDKTSFLVLLVVCIMLAWKYTLYYFIGVFMFIPILYLIVEFQKKRLEFHQSFFITRIIGIIFCIFIPLVLFALIRNKGFEIEKLEGFVINAGLFGVVFEEFLFRGLLWKCLRNLGMEEYKIVVTQAILFWLAHYNLLLAGSLSFWTTIPLLGIVLGILVFRSKSLTSSIVAHFLYNLFVSFIKN